MSDDPPADRTRPEPAGWLARFLGRFGPRRDPTRAWPQDDTPLPPFDLAARSLGGLRLGDPLGAAEFLGRPDAVEQARHYLTLLYSRGWLILARRSLRKNRIWVSIYIDWTDSISSSRTQGM